MMPYRSRERPDAGEVAGRRDQDAGRARHRLEQDRGDRRRALGLDDPLEVVQRPLATPLRASSPRTRCGTGTGRRSARVRGRTRSASVASRRSRRSPRRCCRGTSGRSTAPCRGRCAGAPSRIAFSFASAPPLVKNTLREPVRAPCEMIRSAASPRVRFAVGGADGREQVGLLLDRRHDGRMLVPDVDVDQLAGEVEVAVAGVVPHRRARAAGDHEGGRAPACADQEWKTYSRSSFVGVGRRGPSVVHGSVSRFPVMSVVPARGRRGRVHARAQLGRRVLVAALFEFDLERRRSPRR